MREGILRTAGWLSARGIGQGDVVAVRLDKSLAFLELHLGAMALGAAILPLHPAATEAEATYLCSDAGAKLRIFDSIGDHYGEPARVASVEPDQTAILLYTSGTTGSPKGAPISHGNLLAMVRALHQAWHWSDQDVLLHALPLFHVHGLFVAQWGAMYAGARAHWLEKFDVDAVLDALPSSTVFMGVPTFYARLLSAEPRGDLSGMRLFTSGSAPLPAAHHQAFEERFGHRILERYGMTEIGIVLSNPYDGERRPGAVGFPLPGARARVVRQDDTEAAVDEVGEICIAGPSVFAGYLGRPEATAKALRSGWMHTGDLGWIDAEGYIHVAGRAGDMILSGGFNVYPREVEAAIRRVLGQEVEVAVFGLWDADLGERVCAAIVGELDADELTAKLRHEISPYKLPRRWFRVQALPRNSMGKVQKARLRERYDVQVRDGGPDDLERLVHGNRMLARTTESLELDPQTITDGVRGGLEGAATYLVAERAGAYVGQLMLTREWSDWRAGWIWWIQSVWVEQEHRRTGVYTALWDTVVSRARNAGVVGLRLYVEHDNTRAVATYERLGMCRDSYLMYTRDLR